MDGYAGKILRIDLGTEKVVKENLSEQMCEDFIGGRGFVAKTLYEELPPDIDPLGTETCLSLPRAPCPATFCRPAARLTLDQNHRPQVDMPIPTWAVILDRP
jgi:aldehyde:ferredoxin oxidoreductase